MDVSNKLGIPYSGIATAKPFFSQTLSLICLTVFAVIKAYRWRTRKLDKNTKMREIIFFIVTLIAVIDIIVCLVTFRRAYIADLLRPIIVILCYRSQQDFFVLVAWNLKDSMAMLTCILIWVLYFALLGQFIF